MIVIANRELRIDVTAHSVKNKTPSRMANHSVENLIFQIVLVHAMQASSIIIN